MKKLATLAAVTISAVLLIISQTTKTLNIPTNVLAFYNWSYQLFDYQVNRIWDEVLERDWIGLLLNPINAAITLIYISSLFIEILIHAWQKKSWSDGWQASSIFRLTRMVSSKTARADVYMFVYNRLALDSFIMQGLMLLGPLFVFALIQANLNLQLFTYLPNPWLQFFVYVVAQDFVYYWFHRVSHESRAMWEIHKFHHSATEMNLITGVRDHPFEKAMQTAFSAVPLAILGAPIEQFVAFWLLVSLVNVWFHSDFDWHFGWLDYVLVSPRTHRIHHSMLEEHWDLNYGVIFSVWDHIFGTYYKGSNVTPVFGVTDNYFNKRSFFFDLFEPLRRFFLVAIGRR